MAERLGLSREEIGRAAWAVEPDGRRFEGAAAINRTLNELGGSWALLAALYQLPPIRSVQNAYYRRVARRRAWF